MYSCLDKSFLNDPKSQGNIHAFSFKDNLKHSYA